MFWKGLATWQLGGNYADLIVAWAPSSFGFVGVRPLWLQLRRSQRLGLGRVLALRLCVCPVSLLRLELALETQRLRWECLRG